MKTLWLLLVTLCCARPISAQNREFLTESGNAFAHLCGNVIDKEHLTFVDVEHRAECGGYVNGFISGFNMGNAYSQIDAISKARCFKPAQNFIRISRIAKGYAPMFSQILEDYIRQNEPEPTYRKARLKAAKRMLGV